MIFREERELKTAIKNKLIDKFNHLFIKENITIGREDTIEQTIDEVFTQLRTKDLLK